MSDSARFCGKARILHLAGLGDASFHTSVVLSDGSVAEPHFGNDQTLRLHNQTPACLPRLSGSMGRLRGWLP